ncbi:MAG: hypothetical protein LBS52_09065 [Dysgonamonadaceae bacterium]|jgi:hypothetical protein|nr:hypothetical protein [Dysgonamonadaceae bacterium]
MKTEDIKQLLVKFYNGETSREEEARLSAFFRQENLPAELADDRNLFLSLSECGQEPLSGLEGRIDSFIARLAEEESAGERRARKTRLWGRATGIAASLLLVVAIGFWRYSGHEKDTVLADTYQSPEEARKATLQALQLFSQHFSEGMKPVEKANTELKKTQEIIDHTLNKKN